jgi:hypothetical protein
MERAMKKTKAKAKAKGTGAFPYLEEACGGAITPETLEEFSKTTLADYARFMGGLEALFGRPENVTLH